MKKSQKNKQTNEKKQLFLAIIAVMLVIVLAGGGTYAYWSWQSADSQKTNVSVTIAGANLLIKGDNVTQAAGEYLFPIDTCTERALVGTATVTVANETESTMTTTLKLRGSLSSSHGTLNDTTHKKHLHWAVVETSSGTVTSGSCSSPTTVTAISNTCANVTDGATNMDTGTFEGVTTGTDINTTLKFVANGVPVNNTSGNVCTTTRTYRVYVWIDKDYTHTNYGSTINDPMQDLSVVLTWSPNSGMTQNPN